MPWPNHQAGLIDGGAGLPPLAVAIGLPVVLAELSCRARARPVVVGLLTAWLAAEGSAHGYCGGVGVGCGSSGQMSRVKCVW